jgi:hypothetical protein
VDETGVDAYAQQRLFGAATREQVGLLIGMHSPRSSADDDGDEDCLVVGLIPTPLPEVEPTPGGTPIRDLPPLFARALRQT